MEDLKLFYPLIVMMFFIFFDTLARKKRPMPPSKPSDQTIKIPEEWEQTNEYDSESEKEVPWYVEFPEDRAAKKEALYSREVLYKEPILIPEEILSEPLYKRFETPKPQVVFTCLHNSRTVADEVRQGFVMAQILEKPRALYPYDDNF